MYTGNPPHGNRNQRVECMSGASVDLYWAEKPKAYLVNTKVWSIEVGKKMYYTYISKTAPQMEFSGGAMENLSLPPSRLESCLLNASIHGGELSS